MITYDYTSHYPDGLKPGEIVFRTDDKELWEAVDDYIMNCIDAAQWRKRVVQMPLIERRGAE